MYLIVGLGNPEEQYSRTRHNMGFDTINQISKKYEIDMNRKKFTSIYGSGVVEGQNVILLKPQTYMNESGKAIREFRDFYKIEQDHILVIYDDMDVEKGKIKIRKQGSAGSHNGMKSVIEQLKTKNINRIRIGIGKPEYEHDMINYVINKISEPEYKELQVGIEKASRAISEILKNGIDIAMNKYN